ncbi:appr-1-P processing enzyme family protein (macronuclear) [Tetrahymena thermophila SB210]|uniref:Appr-1-P processing enzyme family protein n=1 Tax=Tetrahymena thermophila (strain SB210) TaxID=312017 RepID=Q22CT8_TETTS|nr:appr-1-P processing enzyme family protein [Tetrahymena thermophila SB210]EAR83100.4 appr-1-P processing enzyme family protein [Tetrahymena thermophila SB210]|eukprot:XP_001030763.4 appr-1-P processing enzyme family protein [Tetrahymena thermophila SB210]
MNNIFSKIQKLPKMMNLFQLKSYFKTTQKPTYTIGNLSSQPILQQKIGETQISIVKNDLTMENVDAIVNAANNFLAHGGGVAGAICRKGGRIIQNQSYDIIKIRNRIENGESVTTEAGQLPCKKVIHTVGPIWEDGDSNEKEELAKCMETILREAKFYKLKSISIPAISSGIFGFPKYLCAKILLEETQKLLKYDYSNQFEEIRFCNFDNETVQVFAEEFQKQFQNKEPQQIEQQSKKKKENNQNEGLNEDFQEEQKDNLKNLEKPKIQDQDLSNNKEKQAQKSQEENEIKKQEIKEYKDKHSEIQKEQKNENLEKLSKQKEWIIKDAKNNISQNPSYVKQNEGDQAIDAQSQQSSQVKGQQNKVQILYKKI